MRKTGFPIILLQMIVFLPGALYAQTVTGSVHFRNGQTFSVQMDVKTSVAQQVSGNAIDFTASAIAMHQYHVIGTTADSTQLHHLINRISFDFEGMGQKRHFDSGNEQDMTGEFGTPVKNLLDKTYDITVDGNGRVLRAKASKSEALNTDERMSLIFGMLRDVSDLAYPPSRGRASFFRVLPERNVNVGDSWYDSSSSEGAKYKTTYYLHSITDSTIVIDLKTNASTVTKSMMMGREAITTMTSTGDGQIVVDRLTGVIRQKTLHTEAHGNTEALGGSLPVTARTTIVIKVKPDHP
jgi:hypothetical protein